MTINAAKLLAYECHIYCRLISECESASFQLISCLVFFFQNFHMLKFQLFLLFSAHILPFYPISHCFSLSLSNILFFVKFSLIPCDSSFLFHHCLPMFHKVSCKIILFWPLLHSVKIPTIDVATRRQAALQHFLLVHFVEECPLKVLLSLSITKGFFVTQLKWHPSNFQDETLCDVYFDTNV